MIAKFTAELMKQGLSEKDAAELEACFVMAPNYTVDRNRSLVKDAGLPILILHNIAMVCLQLLGNR